MDEAKDFGEQLTARVDPAWVEPTEEQTVDLRARVRGVAVELGEAIWLQAADRPLATLRALRAVGDAVDAVATEVAAEAGARGAGYPQLGAAWGLTRQAARLRWPVAVPRKAGAPAAEEGRVDLEMFGGHASVFRQESDATYWWIATGADGTSAEADEDQHLDSSQAAAAAAGAFLAEHQAVTA